MADITTAFMMPFKFSTDIYTILAVDVYGTHTRTITVGSDAITLWWHIIEFANTASPSGISIDKPINLLKTVETALNAGGSNYLVQLSPNGLVGIYNDSTTTGASLTFSSTDIAYALGFTSVGPHLIGKHTWIFSDYQPTHCLYAYSREEDTGWKSKGQIYAVADLPDGTVYGWGNGSARFTRKFNLKYHPKDVDGVVGILSNITPAYPSLQYNAVQWKYPTTSPGLRPPWTVHNFLNAAISYGQGSLIAACFGNFQTNIDGTDLRFERVSLSAESIKGEHFSLSIANYDKFRNVDNITMNLFDHTARNAS